MVIVIIVGIYSLSSELESKFYAVSDSVPTRVYSSVYWLKPGVGASPEEIRFRMKEREYRDVGQSAQVVRPGNFSLEQNDKGEITNFVIYTNDFGYSVVAKETLLGNAIAETKPARFQIQWNHGQVEKVLTSEGVEVPAIALEPTLIAQLNQGGSTARKTVPLGQIPHTLMKAIVLVEDQRFLEHTGIDPRGIARSMWVNLRAGGYVQGASTITQQLARNIYLSRQKTIIRKVKEVVMSIMLEFKFSKDQILEKYLNEVYF